MHKEDVLEYYSSVKAIAKTLEVTVQSIYKWPSVIPMIAAYKLREAGCSLKFDLGLYK